jgi:hypothetical protein
MSIDSSSEYQTAKTALAAFPDHLTRILEGAVASFTDANNPLHLHNTGNARPSRKSREEEFDTGVTASHLYPVITFVESTKFTNLITDLISDDEYADFQQSLASFPAKGPVLEGCGGGVRKVRMAAKGKGTSGGARVLYLYLPNRKLIYLLYLFTKGQAENISADGKKAVRQLAEQIKKEHHP